LTEREKKESATKKKKKKKKQKKARYEPRPTCEKGQPSEKARERKKLKNNRRGGVICQNRRREKLSVHKKTS